MLQIEFLADRSPRYRTQIQHGVKPYAYAFIRARNTNISGQETTHFNFSANLTGMSPSCKYYTKHVFGVVNSVSNNNSIVLNQFPSWPYSHATLPSLILVNLLLFPRPLRFSCWSSRTFLGPSSLFLHHLLRNFAIRRRFFFFAILINIWRIDLFLVTHRIAIIRT